jgi:concentrative nucleoside transporter, CNT family
MTILHGAGAIAVLLALAWALSEERWQVPIRAVVGGIGLQIALALLLVKFPPATALVFKLNDIVDALQNATDSGTALVFGYLGSAPLPFAETIPARASFSLFALCRSFSSSAPWRRYSFIGACCNASSAHSPSS